MKKLICLILALILLVMLPGCGLIGRIIKRETPTMGPGISEQEDSDYEQYSESDVYSTDETVSDYSDSDVLYGQMSAAEKATFIQQAALSGVDVTFNADGSTTFVYDDGTVARQNADGTWTYSNEDGTATTQLGGEWPDNEFTRLVPKPDFDELFGAVTEEKTFTILFTETDMGKTRAYIEAVKAKGFTKDAESVDETAFGVTVLSYSAKNAAGYKVTVSSAAGINSIMIEKD